MSRNIFGLTAIMISLTIPGIINIPQPPRGMWKGCEGRVSFWYGTPLGKAGSRPDHRKGGRDVVEQGHADRPPRGKAGAT